MMKEAKLIEQHLILSLGMSEDELLMLYDLLKQHCVAVYSPSQYGPSLRYVLFGEFY